MSAVLFFWSGQQILDGNGDPIVGATIETYEAGTTTPLSTFSDSDRNNANANPASGATTGNQVSDSNGRFGTMFLAAEAYKYVIKDADGVTILTQDDFNEGTLDTSDGSGSNQFRTLVFASGFSELVNNQSIAYVPLDQNLSIPAGATGSQAAARSAPTATKSFRLRKNGTVFGTCTFTTGSNTGSFSVASTTQFSTGDTIEVLAPTTADSTLRYVGIALKFDI